MNTTELSWEEEAAQKIDALVAMLMSYIEHCEDLQLSNRLAMQHQLYAIHQAAQDLINPTPPPVLSQQA